MDKTYMDLLFQSWIPEEKMGTHTHVMMWWEIQLAMVAVENETGSYSGKCLGGELSWMGPGKTL